MGERHDTRRLLRHEPLDYLGPERALTLREVVIGGIPVFEVTMHGEPGWLFRASARGDAESWFDGYLVAHMRAYLAGWSAGLDEGRKHQAPKKRRKRAKDPEDG